MLGFRIVSVVAFVLAGVVGVAGPAQAASGPWRQVAAGAEHTCAINTSDSLYCWGDNENGQTGDGTTNNPHPAITRVAAAGVWASVAAGGQHTCGITKSKNLYCWGNNSFGQTGDGTTTSPRLTLRRVGATGVWASIAGGTQHTCGITTAKNLYCWGRNDFGQTGDGTTTSPRLTLHRVGAAGVWVSITGGDLHTCGITTARNLYCWGYNQDAQIGDGTTNTPRLTLARVGAAGVWANVSAGDAHTCGVTTAKDLYCWGYNGYGQTGDGTTTTPRRILKRVGAAGVWTNVSAGAAHTCGITTAKNLYCWGANADGEVGDGTTNDPRLTLNRVGAAGVWADLSAGGYHTCGITTAKNLYCWGENAFGQTGDGTTNTPRLTLFRVA